MERPLRTTINISNLIRMGVPKEFIYKSMNDFHDFGSKNLKALKNFIKIGRASCRERVS